MNVIKTNSMTEYTRESKIGELIPDGYEMTKIWNHTVIGNVVTFQIEVIKQSERSLIKEASGFGYKIGDYCLFNDKRKGKILFKIEDFYFDIHKVLIMKFDRENYSVINNKNITNKIIIHTPTQEQFDFIKLKIQPDVYGFSELNKTCGIHLNEALCNSVFDAEKEGFTILTVDAYMALIGEKEILITSDGKKIYNGMKCYHISESFVDISFISNIVANPNTIIKGLFFSTRKLAEQYVETHKSTNKSKLTKEEKLALYEELSDLSCDANDHVLGENLRKLAEIRCKEIEKLLNL